MGNIICILRFKTRTIRLFFILCKLFLHSTSKPKSIAYANNRCPIRDWLFGPCHLSGSRRILKSGCDPEKASRESAEKRSGRKQSGDGKIPKLFSGEIVRAIRRALRVNFQPTGVICVIVETVEIQPARSLSNVTIGCS